MGGGENAMETVIRNKDSQEQLGNSKLDVTEKSALTQIMKETKNIENKSNSKVEKANNIKPIIDKYFNMYNRKFDSATGKFVETKKDIVSKVESKERLEIQKNVETFYGNLLEDIRSQYESLSYEKGQGKQIEETLQLASFFVDFLAGASDAGFVRKDKTPQQTEEKFKFALRGLKENEFKITKKISSDVKINEPEYTLVDTKFETKNTGTKTKEGKYNLPMANLGKDAMDANFKGLIEELNQPGVKITGYEITGIASTVNYEGNQSIQIGDENFIVKDNTTLADGRSRLTEDWLKTKYAEKLADGYTGNRSFKTDVGKENGVDYNDPAHPEYKERSTTAEGKEKLNKIFSPYQGVNIKVNYYIEEKLPKYIYEKNEIPKTLPEYNVLPKTELLIKDGGAYKQYEVSGRKLDQDIPMIKGGTVNEKIWSDKDNDMFDDAKSAPDYKGKSIITRKFDEYTKLSKDDPTNYPAITDPKKNTEWVDKVSWVNSREYGTGEQVSNTPIMNLDLSNSTHKNIYEDMKKTGVLTDEGISNQKTDKYISEYMEKWTKQYVKDGIVNRNKK
ncbi:MAG: hypothetical protein WC010_03145 [Candidatus Absconditabacterales bacterium]